MNEGWTLSRKDEGFFLWLPERIRIHDSTVLFVASDVSQIFSANSLPFLQVPEYCKVMEEAEILDQAFQLIFAFDEIVALGYRESVNLAQIRTFTEMDSHEEKVYQAVRQVSSGQLECFLLWLKTKSNFQDALEKWQNLCVRGGGDYEECSFSHRGFVRKLAHHR